MNLPGFTAEASLYRSGYGYRAAVKGGPAGTAQVLPQASLSKCYERCSNFFWNCDGACRRAGDSGVCLNRCLSMANMCDLGCEMMQV
jgi:hypothetical protein